MSTSTKIKKELSKRTGVPVKNILMKSQNSNEAFLSFQKAATELGWSFEKQIIHNTVQYTNRLVVTESESLVFNGFGVGYFRIVPNGDGLEMSRIQVDDAFRGRGMATLMMSQMMQIFFGVISKLKKQIPFKILTGDIGFKSNNWTQVDMDVKLKLYTNFGFKINKIIEDFVKLEFDYNSVTDVIELIQKELDIETFNERFRKKFGN
jgi:ribosomal protein S18 acetylase RimI-like enzyme